MAMGTRRQRRRQERLWVGHRELAKGPAHPFGRFFLDCFASFVNCGRVRNAATAFFHRLDSDPSGIAGIFARLRHLKEPTSATDCQGRKRCLGRSVR